MKELPHMKYGIIWEDLLSDEEIEKIHKLANELKEKTGDRGKVESGKLMDSVRRSDIIWIGNNPETYWLYKKITDSVKKINDETFQFELNGGEPLQYTSYHGIEKGEYTWHNDITNFDPVRKISVSILLSDTNDFKGGSFLFAPDGKPVEIEQEKGRMIVFPSWTPHCITPVLKGTRISLVMWLYGEKFK